MKAEKVILVDNKDKKIGTEEKIKAHKKGKLHRAFSIFVFNFKGKLLLQKRASEKYHCGGLWTNTCCSHPRPEETIEDAAHRRLKEEMGFDCELMELFDFQYKFKFDNGLTENEIDHVFIGFYDKKPIINKEEADDYRWIDMELLGEWIKRSPSEFTPWFLIAIKKIDYFL